MPNKIQPREYSRGSGIDGASYITDSDGNLNVFNVKHDDDGLWLNSNYSNPDNLWNPDNRWVIRWKNIFRDIESASLPLTIEPPKDLRPASWFETHTDIQGSGLKQITSEMLRNAVRDGNLNNWKPDDKPNANNQYSIQEVKDFYKEYAHILPNE